MSSRAQRGIFSSALEPFPGKIPRCARDDGDIPTLTPDVHASRQSPRVPHRHRPPRRAGARHPSCPRPARGGRDRRPVHEEPRRRPGAAVRARAARGRHAGASSRSRSICSARCGGCAWPSAWRTWTPSAARISEMLNLKVPEGLFGKLAMLPRLAEIGKFPPRVKSGRPPCQEVVLRGDAVNLDQIPFLTTWPGDGGRYITLPDGDHDRSRPRGIRNVGMYRVQVLGRDTLAMHWQRHKVGAAHWREMAETAASGCRSSSRSAAIPRASTPAPRRSRRRSTSSSSPASSAARPWSWPAPSRATSRCPPRPRSCSRATSIRPSRW